MEKNSKELESLNARSLGKLLMRLKDCIKIPEIDELRERVKNLLRSKTEESKKNVIGKYFKIYHKKSITYYKPVSVSVDGSYVLEGFIYTSNEEFFTITNLESRHRRFIFNDDKYYVILTNPSTLSDLLLSSENEYNQIRDAYNCLSK